MKSLFLVGGLALALATPLAVSAQQAPNGEQLFNDRCGACHNGGGAPSKATLATHTPAQIVEILTTGPMAPMAGGMSDADKQAVAAYLTAAAPGAAPAAPAAPATNAPATNAPATPGV